MQGHNHRHRHFGAGGRPPPLPSSPAQPLPVPQQQFNPNFLVQNPALYPQNPPQFLHQSPFLQNPNALIQGFNAILQYSNFPIHQQPTAPISNVTPDNPYSQTNVFPTQIPNPPVQRAKSPAGHHNATPSGTESLERIEVAVMKARRGLVAAGETVSAWKVSQSVLVSLQADSWDSLGFQLQEIPSLHRLIVVEGKINAFIHCYVGVRRITSLYDLELAICKNEGIEKFEELELGPLLRHPLVMHYFSVGSDVTSVYHITSEEIVSLLAELVDVKKGKSFKIEDLLNFIAKKCEVDSWEKLGARIQSLGMHITFIREARSSEDSVLQKCIKTMGKNSDKKRKKRPLFSLEKPRFDERFSAITQRLASFSSLKKDFCGKYTRFDSSSSDDDDIINDGDDEEWDDGGDNLRQSSTMLKNNDRVSNCPYPSVSEEMKRLGLKDEVGHTSPPCRSKSSLKKQGKRKKRKIGNLNDNGLSAPKLHSEKKNEQKYLSKSSDDEVVDQSDFNGTKLLLNRDSIRMFITTWKEVCREHNAAKVFEKMLDFYDAPSEQRNGQKWLFSKYPFLGLLNVAVASIKNRIWDSIYDTFQSIGELGETDLPSGGSATFESIDVESSDPRGSKMQLQKHRLCVTVDDIMRKVKEYFVLETTVSTRGNSPIEKILVLIRKLCQSEAWLCQQFSVEGFQCLGHGDYYMFLEKHSSTLPVELCEFLQGEVREHSPLEVRVLQKLLVVLLSQATGSLWADESIMQQNVFDLVTRQFPALSFTFIQNGSLEDLLKFVKQQSSNIICSSIFFSATLFEGRDYELKGSLGQLEGIPGSVTSKDAMEVLLKAPMLSDLNSWSHWDLIYSPSLGPLLGWLLNEVNVRDLLCLVTKDGKILRIDPLASANSFFQSLLRGSSYQVAVELLSLFTISGGRKHAPVSLMKCHARQAFEVVLSNSHENEGTTYGNSLKRTLRKSMNGEDAKLSGSLKSEKEAISLSSRLLLDCLSYLPSEFRSFAADVLLCGFQSMVKDASSAVLHECRKQEERLMLHEVGFSLGIIEWIDDHRAECPMTDNDSLCSPVSASKDMWEFKEDCLDKCLSCETKLAVYTKEDEQCENLTDLKFSIDRSDTSVVEEKLSGAEVNLEKDAALIIESIRQEEFGIDSNLSEGESSMLKKQHARLGRALHCLSQELYSQDSHFLLELVQNADDNVYPEEVEPTLMFILQDTAIIVLNNEQGFTAKNIRALCDVGSSTKKGSAGYIGQKGIGFKSVFRVTDAPEIHSNGFHVKFDISEGQIGFVLPTIVPPCNMDLFARLSSTGTVTGDAYSWNTCILLPFKSKLSEGESISSIFSMFSDLNPSLLLFLHRLKCIKFRNMIDGSLIVMKKEIVGSGIVSVSQGKEKTIWFLASKKLQPEVLHSKVEETEISIAFALKESAICGYDPCLEQQPAFAFLPLRTYGLKFILQGDFVLPSSREEVDGDSPWNQWLLSEFPDLFVNALKTFCALPCYRESPGKAVSDYMNFVPLIGEVHGFFSCLPRMIISKLRLSNCLLLEGLRGEWVPPCKVIRSWNQNARLLLHDSLLLEHLGLGFLDREIILSNSLASSLGVVEYGPKILVQLLISLSHAQGGLKSVELSWLFSLLNEIHNMLAYCCRQAFNNSEELDLINNLRVIPFIPLSDGRYSSLDEGTIWLSTDSLSGGFDGEHGYRDFPRLCAILRIVNPALFSAISSDASKGNASLVNNVAEMLHKIGVQRLSAHEIIKVHILPSISDEKVANKCENLMADYLAFVMLHFQSSCLDCHVERENLISELSNIAFVSTTDGYTRPAKAFIHFSREYGNSVDVNKLFYGIDYRWCQVDVAYLKHPITRFLLDGLVKWREFFQRLGVTDFIKVVQIQKPIEELSHTILQRVISDGGTFSPGLKVTDWESEELSSILSLVAADANQERSKYLLEVLDAFWDDYYHDKTAGYLICKSEGTKLTFKSSFVNQLHDIQWVASTMDHGLHYPKELFYDCEAVRSIAGASAPYAIPKIKSEKLLTEIGFKTQVTVDDISALLQLWRRSGAPFTTSISQMTKFYAFIWNALSTSRQEVMEALNSGPFVFVPCVSWNTCEDDIAGAFLSPEEVYWHDITGALDHMRQNDSTVHPHYTITLTLSSIYPSLFGFFVNECGVKETPPMHQYVQILLQLSSNTLPLQAAKTVFQVLVRWSNSLNCSATSSDDVSYLKERLLQLDFTVLPTTLDQWVSLHPSFGLLCWCDDDMLKEEFKHSNNINFLYFGELCHDDKEMLRTKVSLLLQTLGIPSLSEVVTREAVYYGPASSRFQASMVEWALPFAQRYIYNFHREQYEQLRLSRCGFKLRVVVVEQLYYRNVIKRCDITSKKRSVCSCLLQDCILYATPESDAHSIFMELSRLFFDGVPQMHFANFLLMIKSMAESGCSGDNLESFLLNGQKMLKLPDEDPVWSLLSSSMENDEAILLSCASANVDELKSSNHKRKHEDSNWPPVGWKTAPDFSHGRANGSRVKTVMRNGGNLVDNVIDSDHVTLQKTDIVSMEMEDNIIIEDEVVASAAPTAEDDPVSVSNVALQVHTCIGQDQPNISTLVSPVDIVVESHCPDSAPSKSRDTDQSPISVDAQQATLVGRLGEVVASKYFNGKYGKTAVRWVNENGETGLPYDIVIEEKGRGKEYIEVKATRYESKSWFVISTREWQYAVDKGDAYSIAHVTISSGKAAKITIYRNPLKLCQLGKLHLALAIPKP